MSHVFSAWSIDILSVCMSFALTSITYPFVLLTAGVLGFLLWFFVNI